MYHYSWLLNSLVQDPKYLIVHQNKQYLARQDQTNFGHIFVTHCATILIFHAWNFGIVPIFPNSDIPWNTGLTWPDRDHVRGLRAESAYTCYQRVCEGGFVPVGSLLSFGDFCLCFFSSLQMFWKKLSQSNWTLSKICFWGTVCHLFSRLTSIKTGRWNSKLMGGFCFHSRFRRTPESLKMLDSTSHAFVRALLYFKEYERLLEVLNDKVRNCLATIT